ncbi:MAG: UDP-N-acetylmuramoyl-L-alanyl-D-glutamate--2,6-diaminopimelate ligase [Clostridia bacterium]|nr:UDP-N-acetylmuramoyl-L-alanyl-D-glutamate--2,6-diaminopimelate ligase [Clostridia bacterium]
MKLAELLEAYPYSFPGDLPDAEISSLEYDSRKAGTGSLFFCLPGARADGHDFAFHAYETGCRCFVVEREVSLPADAVQIRVDNARRALAHLSARFFGDPAKDLTVIGVTGTKGKTTTAILISEILCACGIRCAYIGTNGVVIGEKRFETVNSTPESRELHRFFAMMRDSGFTHVAMEVSSQALDHYRVEGIPFDTAVFTNLSEDHVGEGEHASFEEYRDAKRKLFLDYGVKHVVTNIDDPVSAYMTEGAGGRPVTVSMLSPADYRAFGIENYRDETSLGIDFSLETEGKTIPVRLRTPGRFSVYNGMEAIAAAAIQGIRPEDAARALRSISVRGRMEMVDALPGITFIIDYAHNGISLTSALTVLREYGPKRLICVFGCIGGRTYLRRRELAEASTKLADFTILTSDNPDNEKPEDIIEDVLRWFDPSALYTAIPDREEAVRFAVRTAREGDIVLFAGKGHETYQIVEGKKVPFSERKILLDEAEKVLMPV